MLLFVRRMIVKCVRWELHLVRLRDILYDPQNTVTATESEVLERNRLRSAGAFQLSHDKEAHLLTFV